jgi:hypothetical protein
MRAVLWHCPPLLGCPIRAQQGAIHQVFRNKPLGHICGHRAADAAEDLNPLGDGGHPFILLFVMLIRFFFFIS